MNEYQYSETFNAWDKGYNDGYFNQINECPMNSSSVYFDNYNRGFDEGRADLIKLKLKNNKQD